METFQTDVFGFAGGEVSEKTNTEINELIHTRLFKTCWHEDLTENDFFSRLACPKCGNPRHWQPNPNYCESIADAWRVVEEMQRRGFVWSFSKNSNEFAAQYDARFFLEKEGVRAIAIEKTLPLAICKAALEAIDG